jgi:hypothetical protein
MKRLYLVCTILLLSIAGTISNAQQIGLQLYSLRNEIPKDVPGSLALIKSWGVQEIEGGSTYGLSADEFTALCKKIISR